MKKTLLITLTAALATNAAWAAPVTPTTALEQARDFVKQGNASSTKTLCSENSSEMKVVYTGPNNTFYVISKGQDRGYVIVAGDDCARTILGYSNSGNFNLSTMPTSQREWIMQYSHQVALAAETGVTYTRSGDSSAREAIGPLIGTQWGQGEPYNDNLPQYTNNAGEVKTVYTGCVATALAQIMNYHKWPEKAVGKSYATMHYNSANLSKIDTLTYTFGEKAYDWANMIDHYTDTKGIPLSCTEAERKAVAELMSDCGYAVKMDYNDSGEGSSGAYSVNAALAIADNFCYDQSAHVEWAAWYTAEQWEELVYNQLKNYGPVLYCATSLTGGHSFVCDGYDGSGHFHINWGWYGNSDNYFALTALKGDGHIFTMDNQIVANIQQPKAGSVRTPGKLALGYSVIFGPDETQMPFCYANVQNVGMESITFIPGYYITSKATGEIAFYEAFDTPITLAPNESIDKIPSYVLGSVELPAGEYTLGLAYKGTDGNWHNITDNNRMVNTVDMTVPAQGDWKLTTTVPYEVNTVNVTTLDSLLIGVDNPIQLDVKSNAGISESPRKFKLQLYSEGVSGEPTQLCSLTSDNVLFDYANFDQSVLFTIPASTQLPTGWVILQITDLNDVTVLVTRNIKCGKPSGTGISNVSDAVAPIAATTAIYTLDGTCLNTRDTNTLSPGIYLQKTADGATRKILVK